MGKAADRTRHILQAYGYTPRTLAIDLDVSPKVARRILQGENDLYLSDYYLLQDCILGVDLNFLFCQFKPGEMKAERERREAERAEKQRKDAEQKAKWEAEAQERRERWRNMTPQEKCADTARVIIPLLDDCERRGFTITDVAREIIKQAEARRTEGGAA